MKMRVALQAMRVWEAIEHTDVDFEVDREALLDIYSAVPDSVMASLAGRDSAKAAWDAIKLANVGHERVRDASLQTMRLKFEELKMGDDESVEGFAACLNTLVTGLRSLGENISDIDDSVKGKLKFGDGSTIAICTMVLLRTKDEAFGAMRKVLKRAEVEVSKEVKALRTDRGGEFTSKQFAEYCENRGIRHFLTAPYSPQQNGVVERRNQTVVSMARSLLKSKNMPGALWGEAVSTAIYLLNRSPNKSVQGKTPYEA